MVVIAADLIHWRDKLFQQQFLGQIVSKQVPEIACGLIASNKLCRYSYRYKYRYGHRSSYICVYIYIYIYIYMFIDIDTDIHNHIVCTSHIDVARSNQLSAAINIAGSNGGRRMGPAVEQCEYVCARR